MMTTPLPKEFLTRLDVLYGDHSKNIIDAFSVSRKGSFRINTLRGDGTEVFAELREKGIPLETSKELEGVFFFDRIHEYALKGTRAFYDGKIYLQSLASLLPVLTLAPEKSDTLLDVCAAPGSKTTQISALIENTGKITAIEQNQIRYDKLMHNARLQGATNIEGVKMDARKYLRENQDIYDKILLDVPCSAEGRIHINNEKSYGFWSITNIRNKSALQTELISLAWTHLAPGGVLVYSTCTLAPEENEGVISQFLKNNPDARIEDIDIGLSGKDWWTSGISAFEGEEYGESLSKTVRILPSDETEGFYLARIRKA